MIEVPPACCCGNVADTSAWVGDGIEQVLMLLLLQAMVGSAVGIAAVLPVVALAVMVLAVLTVAGALLAAAVVTAAVMSTSAAVVVVMVSSTWLPAWHVKPDE